VTGFLDEKRREIDDRLAELKPLVAEYGRLQDASKALAGIPASKDGASAPARAPRPVGAPRRGPGRPRGSKSKTGAGMVTTTRAAAKSSAKPTAKRRAGRRKGSGPRAALALALVRGQPGITIPELAGKMGIKQNYLYRVLPGLEREKKIKKDGRGWLPAK
jgi:hypothetical protein